MENKYLKMFLKKHLKEIESCVLADRKYTVKLGDEALDLINKLRKKYSRKHARMLSNRLDKLDICADLGESIYDPLSNRELGDMNFWEDNKDMGI